MKVKLTSLLRTAWLAPVLALFVAAPNLLADQANYVQTDLVSNSTATPANFTDPNLVNPWGSVSNGGSPFWVSDQGTGLSSVYATPPGTPLFSVTVPQVGTPPGVGPTGIVAITTGFNVDGTPAAFIFATLDGTIAGWNGTPTFGQAVTEATVPGAVFTGLAQASNSSGTFLYAADFANNRINVFNSSYTKVSLSGSFTDPHLPAGYSPYNIQTINGNLYVEYAPIGSNGLPVVGSGNGIVDVFDTNGNFVQRLISNGGQLNVPWGIAQAPASFGKFGGDLLVGNFGNGWINAFNPITGAFVGTLDVNGAPFAEASLWSLNFGVGGSGGTPGVLYFTAGLKDQKGGLLGSLTAPTPVPEPGTGTLTLLGSGLIGLLVLRGRLTPEFNHGEISRDES